MDGDFYTYNDTLDAGDEDEKWDRIRCDDPNATGVAIHDNCFSFSPRLGDDGTRLRTMEALRSNTIVTKLCLLFRDSDATNFDVASVLHVIQNRRGTHLSRLARRPFPTRKRRIV